jgi:hypothetical protein
MNRIEHSPFEVLFRTVVIFRAVILSEAKDPCILPGISQMPQAKYRKDDVGIYREQ